jgi:hypothetical protein
MVSYFKIFKFTEYQTSENPHEIVEERLRVYAKKIGVFAGFS